MDETPTQRRWFQFSLRTLLIFVTLAAIPLGWLGWQAHIVRERKAMLGLIKRYPRPDGFPHSAREVRGLGPDRPSGNFLS